MQTTKLRPLICVTGWLLPPRHEFPHCQIHIMSTHAPFSHHLLFTHAPFSHHILLTHAQSIWTCPWCWPRRCSRWTAWALTSRAWRGQLSVQRSLRCLAIRSAGHLAKWSPCHLDTWTRSLQDLWGRVKALINDLLMKWCDDQVLFRARPRPQLLPVLWRTLVSPRPHSGVQTT